MVLQGVVESKEAKGYMIDLGLKDKAKEESMLAREVFALNEKLEKKKITKDDQSGLLEQLDLKDRLVLKKSFCK